MSRTFGSPGEDGGLADRRTENQISITDLVTILSLDGVRPLHEPLGLGGLADVTAMARAIVKESGLPTTQIDIYPTFARHAEAPGDQSEAAFLAWVAGAFTGSHVAQPQVSVWLQLLRQVRNGLANGTLALAPAETASVRDFLSLVDTQIDAEAFEAKMDIVRRATMTDWDQRIHMLYGYVYRDTHAGADPLLPLKFANQGNGIKRAVGLYPFDRRPDFPHEELMAFGMKFFDDNGIWMPEKERFPSLPEVK
ncbi:Hypothetical protein NGAL_HAMBI2605_62370 [Neorhizobium galegae bv. orientalis]|nr:Hypothetical protein NGAL_HAMBI2605_62370 [Neorhizobium galegae bv. orientalis]